MPRLRLPLLLLCLLLAGCARAMEVGSGEAGQQFRLNVENQTGVTMTVSYNDGRGDALLGSVASGRTEYFVVTRPATPQITVMARSVSGTRTAGPYTITLTSGTPQTVRLRQVPDLP